MATVMVSVEGVVARKKAAKPVKVVRGQRRKALNKLKSALKSLENQDFFEERRASNNGYTPFVIFGLPNSKWRKALTDLKTRCDESLAAKA